jgi:hypothetical protein
MTWGLFTAGIDPAERLARLRSLRAMAILMCRPHGSFIDALKHAEVDADALTKAQSAFEQVPALARRHLLASYANLFGGPR